MQNMTLILQAIPSMHKTEQGKGALWSGVYQREAVTALRTIRQQKGRILLENKDRYLVFLDRELDGSAKEKGTGPSLAAFKADKSTVIEAEIRNSWVNQLIFHSKNDFRCLDFALWSTETSCSNAEFESAIKKNTDGFHASLTERPECRCGIGKETTGKQCVFTQHFSDQVFPSRS